MAERFRFADAGEWISHHGFDELKYLKEYLPVIFRPILKIVAKFRFKYGVAFTLLHY